MKLNLGLYAWDTGALVSILGMLTVFAVLVIIMAVLMIMERIFAKNAQGKKTQEKKPEKAPEVKKKATAPQKASSKSDEELAAVIAAAIATDSEIVAVITAAIAASMGVPERSLKIKSFKRVGKAWTDASRQENIYNSL